jgi:hypothetical protein
MKKSSAALVLAFFVGLSATGKTQGKPTNGETPLTTEELKLYGDFLDSFRRTGDESTPVGLYYRTVPLILNPPGRDQCSQEIGFTISEAANQTPHLFPESIAKGRRIYLIDRSKPNLKELQSGLLSVSEIGFDNDHRFAVFTFKFVQAGVSGARSMSGGTLVFRKANAKWSRANETCLDWMT